MRLGLEVNTELFDFQKKKVMPDEQRDSLDFPPNIVRSDVVSRKLSQPTRANARV